MSRRGAPAPAWVKALALVICALAVAVAVAGGGDGATRPLWFVLGVGSATAPTTGTGTAPTTGAATAPTTGAATSQAASTPAPAAPRAGATAPPPLGVRAATLIEASTGQTLYSADREERLAIASTTKLMTALITLHHTRLGTMFAAPPYYASPAEVQIGLVPGERMSVRDLLTAMLLPSANDAAEDLAYNVGGRSVPRFIAMMNAQARELRLRHTHYATPIGLDTSGNYSSAGDLVTLARYLLRTEPFFKAVVAERRAVLRTGSHVRVVVNRNGLVDRYAWANGVKTGHTLQAGYVLVASGTRHGMTLIGAVLGAASESGSDVAALALLNYGFANYELRTPVHAGQLFARPAVSGRPGVYVGVIAASSYRSVFSRRDRIGVRVNAPVQLTGPLPLHAVVGSLAVRAGHRVVARVPLLLAAQLPKVRRKTSVAGVVVLSVTLSGLLVAAGAALGLTMFWRKWDRRQRAAGSGSSVRPQ